MGAQTPLSNQCPTQIDERMDPKHTSPPQDTAFKLDQMGNQWSNIISLKLISKKFLSRSFVIPPPAPDWVISIVLFSFYAATFCILQPVVKLTNLASFFISN